MLVEELETVSTAQDRMIVQWFMRSPMTDHLGHSQVLALSIRK